MMMKALVFDALKKSCIETFLLYQVTVCGFSGVPFGIFFIVAADALKVWEGIKSGVLEAGASPSFIVAIGSG